MLDRLQNLDFGLLLHWPPPFAAVIIQRSIAVGISRVVARIGVDAPTDDGRSVDRAP
jgi:hypothetical protein